MTDKIKALHTAWCTGTGQDLHLRATERVFFELFQMDFTPEDVSLVVKHVLRFNKAHPDCPMRLAFHKICGDLEYFSSLLAESKAQERNRVKPPTPREEIMEAWRPTNGERVKPENAHKLSEFLRIPPTTNHQ